LFSWFKASLIKSLKVVHLLVPIVFISFGLRPLLKLAIFLASVSTNSVAYLARLLKDCRYSIKLLFPYDSLMNSVCLIAIRPEGI
jgi:hypothetical protein